MAELFDIYDDNDVWIGTAERSEAHRLGLWHHTVHCWLVRREEREGRIVAKVLFQQRSANKDTGAGRFDITAAGHLEAGETPEAIVRELREELGVEVAFEALREYGVVREQGEGTVGGTAYFDNEVSRVYGLEVSTELADFRLQEEEVAGLYEADAGELIALMEGKRELVRAPGVVLSGASCRPRRPRSPAALSWNGIRTTTSPCSSFCRSSFGDKPVGQDRLKLALAAAKAGRTNELQSGDEAAGQGARAGSAASRFSRSSPCPPSIPPPTDAGTALQACHRRPRPRCGSGVRR